VDGICVYGGTSEAERGAGVDRDVGCADGG
jgi:hypothetical protein